MYVCHRALNSNRSTVEIVTEYSLNGYWNRKVHSRRRLRAKFMYRCKAVKSPCRAVDLVVQIVHVKGFNVD
jgi:hypothetical protein